MEIEDMNSDEFTEMIDWMPIEDVRDCFKELMSIAISYEEEEEE